MGDKILNFIMKGETMKICEKEKTLKILVIPTRLISAK